MFTSLFPFSFITSCFLIIMSGEISASSSFLPFLYRMIFFSSVFLMTSTVSSVLFFDVFSRLSFVSFVPPPEFVFEIIISKLIYSVLFSSIILLLLNKLSLAIFDLSSIISVLGSLSLFLIGVISSKLISRVSLEFSSIVSIVSSSGGSSFIVSTISSVCTVSSVVSISFISSVSVAGSSFIISSAISSIVSTVSSAFSLFAMKLDKMITIRNNKTTISFLNILLAIFSYLCFYYF